MGTLHYGSQAALAIDDVTLHHLAAVTVAKLRRTEPFLLTTVTSAGRESLWIHPASTVRFAYESAAEVPLDRERLEAMVRETNRPAGLVVQTLRAAAPAAA